MEIQYIRDYSCIIIKFFRQQISSQVWGQDGKIPADYLHSDAIISNRFRSKCPFEEIDRSRDLIFTDIVRGEVTKYTRTRTHTHTRARAHTHEMHTKLQRSF